MATRLIDILLSSAVGVLFSLSLMALKVLPTRVTRKEVEEMIAADPTRIEVRVLREQFNFGQEELRGIRSEVVGLRTDVAKLTATLEMLLTRE